MPCPVMVWVMVWFVAAGVVGVSVLIAWCCLELDKMANRGHE